MREPDKEASNLAAEVIVKETAEYFNSLLSDLKNDAPETTPSKVPIVWGNQAVARQNIVDFSEKNDESALVFFRKLVEIYLAAESQEQFLVELFGREQVAGRKTGGCYSPKDQTIFSEIPFQEVEKLSNAIEKEIMASNISVGRDKVKRISEFPLFFHETFFPTKDNSKGGMQQEKRIKSLLAHEITHLWVFKETELGKKIVKQKLAGDEAMYRDRSDRGSEIGGMDETFAFYTGYLYGADIFEKGDDLEGIMMGKTGFGTNYSDIDTIIYMGIRFLDQKVKNLEDKGLKESKLDWLRKFEMQIIDKAEREESGILKIFIKACLPAEEKRELTEMREIIEKELKPSFESIKKGLRKLEQDLESRNQKEPAQELLNLYQEINWENPDEIESQVFGEIDPMYMTRKYKSIQTPEEIHEEILSDVRDELKYLEKIRKKLKSLIEGTSYRMDLPQELKNGYRMLEESEEYLQEITSTSS